MRSFVALITITRPAMSRIYSLATRTRVLRRFLVPVSSLTHILRLKRCRYSRPRARSLLVGVVAPLLDISCLQLEVTLVSLVQTQGWVEVVPTPCRVLAVLAETASKRP